MLRACSLQYVCVPNCNVLDDDVTYLAYIMLGNNIIKTRQQLAHKVHNLKERN